MTDLTEDLSVVGVVKAKERAVVDREAVDPEVETALDQFAGRSLVSSRVFDGFTGCFVAAECARCAFEMRRGRTGVVSAWTGYVSRIGKLVLYSWSCFDKTTYFLARSIIFFLRSSGFATASPDFSPPA